MKYIKGLDSLRAFAVIVVILGHWGWPYITSSPTINYLVKGLIPSPKFGVDLFFVLSGFLITSILLEAIKNGSEEKLTIIKNFIIRRALRIFPIYYLVIFVLILIGDPYLHDHLFWFVSYTSNILMYRTRSWNSFSHSWSLSVEEQFYLIWPWCIIYIGSRSLKYVFYTAILMGIVMTIYAIKIQHNEFGYLLMPACMHGFGLGALYAYVRDKEDQKKLLMKVINILFPVALLFHFYWSYSKDGGHFNYWFRTKDSIISLWLIHMTITAKSVGIKKYLLENPLLTKIGQISYGIYLIHYRLPWVYEKMVRSLFGQHPSALSVLLNPYYSYIINLILLFCLAQLSFQFFEKPIMKLKRFFEYKKSAPPPVTSYSGAS